MKEFFLERINLLKINTIHTAQQQLAHFWENLFSVGATFFYTLTLLVFLEILYSNIDSFAGYTKNEMLLLVLFTQLNFYFDWIWSTNNLNELVYNVRFGMLDLILVKPVPSLFNVTFKKINIINRIKDGTPNLIVLAFLISWSEINTNLWLVLLGILIFILGQISWHCFRFLFALPVFFIGQSEQIFNVSGTFESTETVPLEGFPGRIRNFLSTLVPTLIASQMSVSVILGKSNPLSILTLVLIVTIIFLLLKEMGWRLALRNYSSASS